MPLKHAMIVETTERMAAHVVPFVTPISVERADGTGDHWGTGTYVKHKSGEKVVLTANHVAVALRGQRITHQFYRSEDVFAVRSCGGVPLPEDAAICATYPQSWTHSPHEAQCVDAPRFAQAHAPLPGELLFFLGFGEGKTGFWFNTLSTTGTPYTTQEGALSSAEARLDLRYDPQYHFVLPYSPARAWRIDGSNDPLPNPPGMSGSLVWNTRRLERDLSATPWSPEDATVTGLVWGWHSGAAALLATRVEHLHALFEVPPLP